MSTDYRLGRSNWRTYDEGIEKEWIITNGLGGYANSTIIGASNRCHSGYLNAAYNAPQDRYTVLSKIHEQIELGETTIDLTAQKYIGEIKNGQAYLNRFELDAVPTYTYQVNDIVLKKTIAMEYGKNTTFVCYEVAGGTKEATVRITPLFTCKELGTVKEIHELTFKTEQKGQTLTLTSNENEMVTIYFQTSEGEYYDRSNNPVSMATPNYMYEESELYSIDIRNGFNKPDYQYTPYDIIVTVPPHETKQFFVRCSVEGFDSKDGFDVVKESRERRANLMNQLNVDDDFAKKLAWASDAFITKRNSTGLKTILAGYPWFLDWGRDTMIALQGLTLTTRRFEEAKEILESFAIYAKGGLLPNVFPSSAKDVPMYNTMDASLWYFYSVYQYLHYTNDYEFIQNKIYPVLKEIIHAYETGTEFGIHMDEDGLVQGGSNLDQITWMDVRVGDWVVTPRHGKPVEINALWYNALCMMDELSNRFKEQTTHYKELSVKVKESFQKKFWNEATNCLYDVIEVTEDKQERKDGRIRPNQIWCVSLPYELLTKEQQKNVVHVVYEQLYTPYGIRSLAPTDEEYKPSYIGKLINRDAAYHMGTTWGYISGGFITAYCKANDYSKEAVERAYEMCQYFEDHMNDGCLNGIAEIFDGDHACTSRGCYTQAWSVGEVLRAYVEDVLPYRK